MSFYSIIDVIKIKIINNVEDYNREYNKIEDFAGLVDGKMELVILVI